jgi:hypothetical protein
MTSARYRIPFSTLAAVLALTGAAHAGPTVLRDDQLRDLALTPVLGRGYSLATGTFQSTCLTGIERTKPSYDYDYDFEQIEADGTTKSTVTTKGGGSLGGSGFGVTGSLKVQGGKTEIEGKTYHNHNIVVMQTVEVYYSSVDESRATLHSSAATLLERRDLPGFFDACGMYYVRSLGRRATFVSIFNYKTETTTRDTSFEVKLEAELKGWGMQASVNVEHSNKFAEEASSKFLTIQTTARGLGKDEKANLIAYDLTSFRAAVTNSFIAMQQDDTGMVSSMEVVPWVENAEFQRVLTLDDQAKDASGKAVSKYAQKRILNQNGEFLAEVDRVARAKLNVFYKAKQCRSQIDLDYKTPDGSALRAEWAEKRSVNHRSGQTIPLSDLDQAVSKANIDKLYQEHEEFLYGDGSGDTGAVACVTQLLESGITSRRYREFKACGVAEQSFGVISGRLPDEHCMPKVIDAPAE